MTPRRRLARFLRQFRRPTLGRVLALSLAVHLVALVFLFRSDLITGTPPPPAPAPLMVELPAAAPGRPLVRPEAPTPARRPAAPPAVAAARPAPPAAPRPAPPPAPPAARPVPAPEPPPAARVPEPPAAPAVPEPAAPPAPPVVAAKPPEAPEPAPRPRLAPEGPPSESPLAGRGFSLLRPRIEVPPLPGPPIPGGGGTRPEGEGAGEAGRERQGQAAIPLHEPPDPNYAEYFLEIKKRIEANLVYPQEAARQGQSGQLALEFVVKKDGSLRLVDLVRSSGVAVLDRYSINTVRLSAPFPPIPDRLGVDSVFIRASFTYVLDHGFRVFGLR